MSYDLTIITPTYFRPKALRRALISTIDTNLFVERLVIATTNDLQVSEVVQEFECRLLRVPDKMDSGASPRNLGIAEALGKYVCFLDDDNEYVKGGPETLFGAASGFDVGICQVKSGKRLMPRTGSRVIREKYVDTACVCARTELARRVQWVNGIELPNHDFHWITALLALDPTPTVNFVDSVICNISVIMHGMTAEEFAKK